MNVTRRVIPPLLLFLCLSTSQLHAQSSPAEDKPDRFVALPAIVPQGSFTPYGYIDNPYHSMVFNRSGVIRSYPPLGFGWWRTEFTGNYGGGVQDHVNYISILQMSVAVGSTRFVSTADFEENHVQLSSSYHTKHMMSYDWVSDSVAVSLKFFLAGEQTLSCIVELRNCSASPRDVMLSATNVYRLGEAKWWGSDGLAARYSSKEDVGISSAWAYGDVFVLGSDMRSEAHSATSAEATWEQWVRSVEESSASAVSTRGRGPMWMALRYRISIPANETRSGIVSLSRGKNEMWALEEFKKGVKDARRSLQEQLKDDEKFWSRCPTLAGDWPAHWQRGWIYDYETLRMNVRRPIGIFKHPWDAMQIHSPRVVLGETCIDMMTLSYADPTLAKEVIYGTFADALKPNIPCAREDGSVNMISSDGSECGTAPMWGFPFHVIKSIFLMTGDKKWIGDLYPHLREYIEWWLRHRTDKEGWLHCNNSWESGQDGSKRFLVAEGNEGAVADFVRTVDVEASMAEAMRNMEFFAGVLGKNRDRALWRGLAGKRMGNVQSMFVDGWFRDFDARSSRPIILKDYFDVMMLSPLTCSVATTEQIDAVRPMFQYFLDNPGHWLEWPPHMMVFTEAAWNAGENLAAAEAVCATADRVYARIDSRKSFFDKAGDPFSYRIPGVANEFWPVRDILPGGENYGWGASLPMHIIRAIVGFREEENVSATEFFLAPFLPKAFVKAGKRYVVRNLRYRKVIFDVTYECAELDQIKVTIEYRSPQPRAVTVRSRSGDEVCKQKIKQKTHTISFRGQNRSAYIVRLD